MLGLLTLLGVFWIPPDSPAEKPAFTPVAFRSWFDAAREHSLTIPPRVLRKACQYRYIFVGGLGNEAMPGYFAQNAKKLRAQGVPREAIHVVNPTSSRTVEDNAESVHDEILAVAKKGPEKLVLIGHSRGACDALLFALENPKFIAKRVHTLFLIQGPFGGTGVADYVAGEGEPIDREMPLGYRLMGKAFGRAESSLLETSKHEAITDLTHRASEDFWARTLKKHRDAVPVVSPRTFYITSRARPSHHPLLQRVTGWYLSTYYGPNDGMVAVEDQSVPELGTVLAVLDAGHTDLTHRFPSARPKRRLREAIVDAIVMAVGTTAELNSRPLVETSKRVPRGAQTRSR